MVEGVYTGLPTSAGGNLPDPVVGAGQYPIGAGVCALVWRLLYGDGDAEDLDSLPDVNPINGAIVRIRPSRQYVTWRGEHPITLLLRNVICTVEGDHLVSPVSRLTRNCVTCGSCLRKNPRHKLRWTLSP